jgi:uncharacterized protein (DUF302 family)
MKTLASFVATLALATFAALPAQAQDAQGLVSLKSPHSPKETIDRLEAKAKERNLNIFLRVDHAAGAARINKTLRPTELLIFGNPQGGTPLMECSQTAGIDLPLKALAWQDAQGQTWLGYNDPGFLAARHKADACPAVENLRKALAGLMDAAIAK